MMEYNQNKKYLIFTNTEETEVEEIKLQATKDKIAETLDN